MKAAVSQKPVVRPSSASPDAANLGRRERSKRAKFERIKRAARKLFVRKGFDGTTTREIAEAADIGVGTLFLYAVTKEDLLVLIFREEFGHAVEAAFVSMPPHPLLEQMMHLFDAMIAHHSENPNLARAFVKELPFVDDRRHGVEEFMATLLDSIVLRIDNAKDRGELKRNVPSRPLARNLFALYFQQVQSWLAGRPASVKLCQSRLRESLELQLSGLRNPARGNR
jgi:AcrR family transcriptional regulator